MDKRDKVWIIGSYELNHAEAAEKPHLNETIEIDQERVTCTGRKALERRVSVAGGIQRQDLPEFLSRFMKKINKPVSGPAKITDAVWCG